MEYTNYNFNFLKNICIEILEKLGLGSEDAQITANVLVSADLRGVHSHGVARLKRYINGIKDKTILTRPTERVIYETPVSALIDAGSGLGAPVSFRSMSRAIRKARKSKIAFVSVRNSNHYGISGYYSIMAIEHDMIGISMTNSAQLVVPTFGSKAVLGTNPISVAVPSLKERPYVLDMATSVVPRGKLEVYQREGKKINSNWAVDENGNNCNDPNKVLSNFISKTGGGLLPLGGIGDGMSGHKGYGLALLVEILSGVLSGSGFGLLTYPQKENGKALPANIGHFFGAISIDAFRETEAFKSDMDTLIRMLKNAPKAENQPRIYIHGEKEWEKIEKYKAEGIPISLKVSEYIRDIAQDLDISFDINELAV